MSARNEKREISALHRASNGPGDPPHDSGKKRSRSQEGDSGEGRRRRGTPANPFVGMGQSNLGQEHRANSGRSLKRDFGSGIASTDSRSKGSLSYTVFAPRSGILDSFEPSPMTMSAAQPSSHHPPSVQESSPEISQEIGAKMDGLSENEGTLSLATVLGEAEIPSPKSEGLGVKKSGRSSDGRSRSSSDPINCIGDSGNMSNPVNRNNVEDDDIVEYEPPLTTRLSPKGTSIVKKGTVKKAVRKIESRPPAHASTSASTPSPARPEANLDGYLVPRPTQASSTSPFAAARGPSSKSTSSGPTSKGNIIPIGLTRPKPIDGKFSGRMQAKPTSTGKTQTSQLKIQSVGAPPSQDQKPLQPVKLREIKSQDTTFKLKIQEWYCEPRHYESNANQSSYSFIFNGSMIKIIFSERPGVETKELGLMWKDIDGFEVVDTAEDESYLWMIICLKAKTISGSHWQQNGLGNSDRVLLHFLESDDPGIHDQWKALLQALAKWSQKRTIRKSTMNGLVKDITDRSSFRVPKVQEIDTPPPKRELKAEPKVSTPPKRRTRSAVSNSNQDELERDSKPIVIEDSDEVVLVHPTGAGSITINRGELARLEPGEFLNDTLIELGLKMWLNDLRLQDPALVDQIHVFSSFFFKKLDAGRRKGCDYNSVKKWTSKFDLFSKKFIIVPINEHLHWYLAVICFPEHVLDAPLPQPPAQPTRVTRSSDAAAKVEQRMSSESDTANIDRTTPITTEAGSPTEQGRMEVDADLADQSERMAIDSPPESQPIVVDVDRKPNDPPILDMTNEDSEKNSSQGASTAKSEKTWILILDSLGGKHPRTIRILREYLQAEAQERRGKVVDIKDTRSSGGLVEDKHLSVPVQPNWCDCGVYLLHYVEVFYANPLEIIALPPGAKRKPKEVGNRYDELWRTDQVKGKRTAFREKLHELSAKWLESKSSSPKNIAPIPGTLPPSRISNPIPLSHLQTDASILEINPPDITAASTTTTEVSALPPGLLEYPTSSSSPSTTIKDVDEVEEIVRPPGTPLTPNKSTIDLSSGSSQPSSNSKPTRRGVKGGSKHGAKHSLDHEENHAPEIVVSSVDQTPERASSVDL